MIKKGYLYKKSRNTPRRHRHWFVLKNDVLSYFDDPSVCLYSPKTNFRTSTFQVGMLIFDMLWTLKWTKEMKNTRDSISTLWIGCIISAQTLVKVPGNGSNNFRKSSSNPEIKETVWRYSRYTILLTLDIHSDFKCPWSWRSSFTWNQRHPKNDRPG